MYGYIYKTTDKKTGLIYVGQHCAEVFESDKYIGSGNIILSICNKYKNDKEYLKRRFETVLLEECVDKESLDDAERFWIKFLNATDSKIGYNLRDGGNGPNFNEDSKKKLSESVKELWKDPEYAARTRKSMSQSKKGKVTNIKLSGWTTTEEERKRKSEYAKQSHWYNNGSVETFVKDCPEGFVKGRLFTTTSYKWIHNDFEQLFISEDKLENYLQKGYVRGMLKRK